MTLLDPKTPITRNFRLSETSAGSLGGPVPIERFFQVGALGLILQTFRDEFGRMRVNSWHRPEAVVEGTDDPSRHAQAAAADVQFLDASRASVVNWLWDAFRGPGGKVWRRIQLLPIDKVITYEDHGHLHIQVPLDIAPRHELRVHLGGGRTQGATSYPLWSSYTGSLKDATGLAVR